VAEISTAVKVQKLRSFVTPKTCRIGSTEPVASGPGIVSRVLIVPSVPINIEAVSESLFDVIIVTDMGFLATNCVFLILN